MRKQTRTQREIRFYSDKNKEIVCAHTVEARNFAKWLELQPDVESYQIHVPLDTARFDNISRADMRQSYFSENWQTDFLVVSTDGVQQVRELVTPKLLLKRATVEQLEFSRRYWGVLNIRDWKVVYLEQEVAQ